MAQGKSENQLTIQMMARDVLLHTHCRYWVWTPKNLLQDGLMPRAADEVLNKQTPWSTEAEGPDHADNILVQVQ